MIRPPLLINEAERLEELHSLNLLDTADEEVLNDIVKLASSVLGCPVSLISLIDSDRQWFKAKVGTEVAETPREISFCGHTIEKDELLLVENALEDKRFMDNPLVALDPNIRFYAGQPLITKNGFKIGTLCVIDVVPKKITDEQKSLLQILAKQTMYIIERRLTDLKIETVQKNISRLFENSPVIVSFMKGPEHEFEYVNPAHILLLSGVNATGKKLLEVQPEAKETGLRALLDDVYQNAKTIRLTDTPFRIGEEMKYFDFIFTPSFNYKQKVDGVMAIVNNVTSQIETRNAITHSLENLKEERDLRERFVAALTHDLRTPLTAAKMSAQLLDRSVDDAAKKLTHRIVNNMDRADEMIRDMLDASKLKAGEKFLLNIKKVNLKELILHTTDDLTTVHGDRFRLHLENIEGYWDEDVLKRMLENLMSNAVKYGSVLFPVTVSTAQENNFVKISVHNHGNPISENETVAIFEPYKRAVNASAQKGWGIGLMLVKGFAEALGGRANVMSSEKDGTVFSLVLPKDSRSTEKS